MLSGLVYILHIIIINNNNFQGMWKFRNQGSNSPYSSYNNGSLTRFAIGISPNMFWVE